MSLIEYDLFEHKIDKIKISIKRIKEHEPPEGYYLAFSGGKDSIVVKELMNMSGVKYDTHFNLTTVDPPELVSYIKKHYPDVDIHRPETSMFKLIPHKMIPPTRVIRYCCEKLKEGGGKNRRVVTGVRWAESVKRSKRKMVEQCMKKSENKIFVHPIIDWSDLEVWEFIEIYKMPYCCLYDEGYKRIGCIMCPASGKNGMKRDMSRFPKFYKMYIRSFDKMIQAMKDKGTYRGNWKNGEEVMEWWINQPEKVNPDQTILFE